MGDVELVTVPNVELIDVGTWEASTGEVTWTVDDLQAAIAAYDDPGYCTPRIKLGHVDPRFDGQPAVGKLCNVRLSADKQTLLGDFVGVPKWLADVMPVAFPNRSIEGTFGMVTATGTKHQFALTAVALLGVTEPAIATLADIESLFTTGIEVEEVEGVNAASTTKGDRPIRFTRHGVGAPVKIKGRDVAAARRIAAAVSIDELREEFYEGQPAGSWAWIRDVGVGEGSFLIVDDDNGQLWQIPWSEADGKITWGEPVPVRIEYVPDTEPEADDPPVPVLLSRHQLRQPVPANRTVEASMPLTTEQLTEIGLADGATDEEVTTRLMELGAWAAAERDALATAPPAPIVAPELPEGVTAIDSGTLEQLVAASAAGSQAAETLRVQARDEYLKGCVMAGKFPPARLEYWQGYFDRDEAGARQWLDTVAAGAAVPVTSIGTPVDVAASGDDALYGLLFPEQAKA